MKINADHLRRLSALDLPGPAYREVLNIIAEMQADDDARRENQRQRVSRHRNKYGNVTLSRDGNVTVTVTPPPAYTTPPKKEIPKRESKYKTHLADDYQFTNDMRNFALLHGYTDQTAQDEHQRFCDSARAHNRQYADWPAAERNWFTSPLQKPNGGNHHDESRSVLAVARRHQAELEQREDGPDQSTSENFARRLSKG